MPFYEKYGLVGLFLIIIPTTSLKAQKKDIPEDMKARHILTVESWRKNKDVDYRDKDNTMLTKDLLKGFKGLNYYDIDYSYVVEGTLIIAAEHEKITIKTSTGDTYQNIIYGKVEFSLHGRKLQLNLYQSLNAAKEGRKKKALFLPFTDLTSGEDTYGGGRYIGLTIPPDEEIIIDFNKAYNPYCAYNEKFSCPLVPWENHVELEIKAGVQKFDH